MSEEMNLYKRCKNIFKFHGVDMGGGGGGESAPEVENAIETHGMGWTDTEEKAGFDIQWDGNTEGLERNAAYVKISDLDIPNDQIVGLKYDAAYSDTHEFLRTTEMTQEMFDDFIEFEQINDDYAWLDYWFIVHKDGVVVDDYEFAHKGIYVADPEEGVEAYISRIYKESSTEEVVHQIDQKYIPGGSGGVSQTVVKLTLTENPEGESADNPYIIESDLTTSEIAEAFESSTVVAWVYCKNYSTDEWLKMYQLNCMCCLRSGEDTTIVFSEPFDTGGGASILTLSFTGEEWNYSVTPIPNPDD